MKKASQHSAASLRAGLGVLTIAGFWTLAVQAAEPSGALIDAALSRLGLVDGQVVDVHPSNAASADRWIVVPIDGTLHTIQLRPSTVRSPSYTVLVQNERGDYETAEPSPERTYRGTVVGLEGSAVALTESESGLRGSIHLPDGTRHWLEPLAGQIAGAAPGQHILYQDEDLAAPGKTCAEPQNSKDPGQKNSGSAAGLTGLAVAELAIDADYEYYSGYGSVAAVEDQINTVINAMNVEYERDVEIRHAISTIIVRTTASDPYNSSDPSTLLGQFRTQWNTSHGNIQRDVAQLFTGRDLNQNVIGIAYLGTICTASGYGVVESDFDGCPNLACKTDLSAHELGHNWNAGHCSCADPYPGWTMNPSITASNRFHPTYSIPTIASFRDSRTCLSVGDQLEQLTIAAPSETYQVGQVAQLSATASYHYGPDQDVTAQAQWSVDRPEFASISPLGLLTVLNAGAESCLTVNASFTDEGVTQAAQLQITLKNPSLRLAVLSSVPTDGAIDGRSPTDRVGAPTGWSIFDLTLNSEPCGLEPSRFRVVQEGGTGQPPVVSSVIAMGGPMVRVTLSKPINPAAWTTISDTLSDVRLRVGYLPCDVDGNGTANPADILKLVDALNGLATPRIWSSDTDRSGSTSPTDIVTLINLLNGADGQPPWNGITLP